MSGMRKHGGFIQTARNRTGTADLLSVRHEDHTFTVETAALSGLGYVELFS